MHSDLLSERGSEGRRRRRREIMKRGKVRKTQRLSVCQISKVTLYEGVSGSGDISPPFLPSALGGGERSTSRPGRFIPEERASCAL